MKHLIIPLFALLLCSCAGTGNGSGEGNIGGPSSEGQTLRELLAPTGELTEPQLHDGRALLLTDSLNVYHSLRPYPIPDCEYTPAPKGYKPVYISSFVRHGQRRLHRSDYCENPRAILACADSLDCLTPFGKEVYAKIEATYNDLHRRVGDLTSSGVEQQQGIAERMYYNYRNVFKTGAPIRHYSTEMPRIIMSMFACNGRLLELCPKLNTSQAASTALTYLKGDFVVPPGLSSGDIVGAYLKENFDVGPALDKLFTTRDLPFIQNPEIFLRHLYICGSLLSGLDIDETDYIWDLFTYDELTTLQWAENYSFYVRDGNSPVLGEIHLNAMKPLLKDFMDKADAALELDVPGADLRFGQDDYLIPFVALIGLNGFVKVEEDPQKVNDVFQLFIVSPMSGNVQMVFYRNRAGDVIVKFLQNEVEAWIPIPTDIAPYYHWADVHKFFESLLSE